MDYNNNNISEILSLLKFFNYESTIEIVKFIFEKYFYNVIDGEIDEDTIKMIKIIIISHWSINGNYIADILNLNIRHICVLLNV